MSEINIIENKISIHSSFVNDTYHIQIYTPDCPVPENGFPAIFVLDGSSHFQLAADVVRLQHIRHTKTGVHPSIVIGIAHQDEDRRNKRFRDFTALSDQVVFPDRMKGKIPDLFGGAEQFLNFIELELFPEINKHLFINQEKRTLFGHSLGGYFSLFASIYSQNLFDTYLACSPSIWWNDYELNSYIERALQIKNDHAQRRHLFVGENEGFMVDDAKQLQQLLKHYNLNCGLYIAPDENHASVVPTIMSRAIRYASK
ncbi:alpha/beta hydrolase [Oceanobacillus sp. 1P07AA]|uniref:alpha/beta hydrolase n=1 Tax=Oceanobacillus sp. 1P07AA TaxID=3132293 RepID=UPI0039A6C9F4